MSIRKLGIALSFALTFFVAGCREEAKAPAPNAPPTTISFIIETQEDTPVTFPLRGSDPEGGLISFALASPPQHGSVLISGSRATYTPARDYNGVDSFAYRSNDGRSSSEVATVAIEIHPVNDAPTALVQTVMTLEDTPLSITLSGSDPEGTALAYTLGATPKHGTLSGAGANWVYTPAPNYNGLDSFTFTASDGLLSSSQGTITIHVAAVGDPPVAVALNTSVDEDSSLNITFQGLDPDGDTLSYSIVTLPSHGTLGGSGASRIYTPSANFNGSDSFVYRVSDGTSTSDATVSIIVNPVNDAPTAGNLSVTTDEDTNLAITLAGNDIDGDALGYALVSPPLHGTVSMNGTATAVYHPAADYNGSDSFTYSAQDGLASSAPATVSITVRPVNDRPVALAQSVYVRQDVAQSITLAGTDVEGSALTYAVTSYPQHGALSGSGNSWLYTPQVGFSGEDSFLFTVNDGSLTSLEGMVSLAVSAYSNGSFDVAFQDPNIPAISKMLWVPERGKVLVATQGNPGRLVMMNPNGSIDPNFHSGNFAGDAANNWGGNIYALAVSRDQRIWVGGDFVAYDGFYSPGLVRLFPNGAVDISFSNLRFDGRVEAIAMQNDALYVGGEFFHYGPYPRSGMIRLVNGMFDPGFNPGPGFETRAPINRPWVKAIRVQSDGKLLVGGGFAYYNGNWRPGLVRLNVDSSLDTSFDASSAVNFTRHSQPGTSASFAIIETILVQPDGRLLVGGDFSTSAYGPAAGVARLQANGALDNSFSTGSDGIAPQLYWSGVNDLALQSDGKVVVVGTFSAIHQIARNNVARLNPDGSVDRFFAEGAGTASSAWNPISYAPVSAVADIGGGMFLIAGAFDSYQGHACVGLARLGF